MKEPCYNQAGQTIYLGDCLEVMKQFSDKSFDLVLTDPPYGLNYRSHWGMATGNMKDFIENDKTKDLIPLIQKVIPELIRIMTDNSEIYWFCGGGGSSPVSAWTWLEFKKFEPNLQVKNVLIWDKQFAGLGWDWRFQYETIFQLVKGKGIKNIDKSASNVLRAKKIIPQAGDHPTPKSIEIISEILRRKPSEIILDPFMGAGTTLAAAKLLGRKAVGIEISEKYVRIAIDRLKQEALF